MTRVRDIFRNISFRGRLLMLLVVVSLIQVIAAAVTYNGLQARPIEDRVQAQLAAALQTATPILVEQQQAAVDRLQALSDDPAFAEALASGDATEIGAAAEAHTESGNLFITSADGTLLAGTEPTVPFLDNSRPISLENSPTLLATVHSVVPFDEAFFAKLANFTDAKVFVVNEDTLVTADVERDGNTIETLDLVEAESPDITVANIPVMTVTQQAQGVTYKSAERPDALAEDLQELTVADEKVMAYVRPLGTDQELYIGSALPAEDVNALFDANRGKLILFIAVLMGLAIAVSVMITKSVGQALRVFVGGTRRVSEGELDQRLPVFGNDEIAVLSESFNSMAENLQDRMDRLVDARQRLRRQVEVFGEALANAHEVQEMLLAVCTIAIESTNATHARFWTMDEDGSFTHAACIGLRPRDRQPCDLERFAVVRRQEMQTHEAPYWLARPVYRDDEVVGVLTLVSLEEAFSQDDRNLAKRLGIQAAVALENARMHEQLKQQATRDGLTGLPNHRSMQDALSRLLGEAAEHGLPLGVAMIDVDNFKSVNDTYGHQTGDDALKMVAGALKRTVAEPSIVARYGGEEFCIVMPGVDAAASVRIADRVRQEIERCEVPLPDGGVLKITASFGVTNLSSYAAAPEKEVMLNDADQALYAAKHGGKNRVELANPQITGAQQAA